MKLSRLQVRNLATIDRVDVDFMQGLSVFTGETGAGKSILIDALTLLAGSRADAGLLRSGTEDLAVEGVFQNLDQEILEELEPAGLKAEEDLLIIRREISLGSVNRVYINQSPVTLKFLESLLKRAVTVHGQADQHALTAPSNRLELVDTYAALEERVADLNETVREIRQLTTRIDEVRENLSEALKQKDLLTLQKNEIKSAALKEGEEEELRHNKALIRDRETILGAFKEAGVLFSDEGADLIGNLSALKRHLTTLAGAFPDVEEVGREVDGFSSLLSDLNVTLERYHNDLEIPDITLQEIEDRLALIDSLKKKYGPAEKDIFAFSEAVEERLRGLDVGDEEVAMLESELAGLMATYNKQADSLHLSRKKGAAAFSQAVTKRLKKLDMEGAVLSIKVIRRDKEPSRGGDDRIDFLVNTNPGETPAPLEKIASGGELSRIQLAILSEISSREGRILIFDEVDQGIGGATAREVGSMLRSLAEKNQVLVVTHLAQVASHAHNHYHVSKEVENGRTFTNVAPLTEKEIRIDLLAEMLSGSRRSKSAVRHAGELFETCQSI